jgi:hypothetical protein
MGLKPIRFKAPAPAPDNNGGSGEDDDNDEGGNNEGHADSELNGVTGIEEDYEEIVDPEIPEKPVAPETSIPEETTVKPKKEKKEKPAKPILPYTDSEGEIIDNKKIKDDITGQLNLFD